MAYNRINHRIYENHNWCRTCNIVTVDKTVMRCPECNTKVRTKPRSYGNVIVKKQVNQNKNVFRVLKKLLDNKQNLSAKKIMERIKEKTGVDILETA